MVTLQYGGSNFNSIMRKFQYSISYLDFFFNLINFSDVWKKKISDPICLVGGRVKVIYLLVHVSIPLDLNLNYSHKLTQLNLVMSLQGKFDTSDLTLAL